MKLKALFIGGTGVISSAVSKLAVEQGWELTLLNRGTKPELAPEDAEVVCADIRNPAEVSAALRGRSFDAVADWIAYVPEHVETDIRLFSGRTGQYIFISSASAYQKPPRRWLIDESTPLANPYWQYSRDKIACEEALMRGHRESGFPCTIVRPTLTYGLSMIPYVMNSWSKPYTIVNRLRQGRRVIVPGDGTSLWTITHNTDFARGFMGLMGNRQTLGQAFNVTSDEALTWEQILGAIAASIGVEPNVVHIASDFIVGREPSLRGSLLGDKAYSAVFDCGKLKRFVPGFAAAMPFDRGVRLSVEYFESHPEMQGVDEEYDAMVDGIIAAYPG